MKRFIFMISALLQTVQWQDGMGAGPVRIVGTVDETLQVDNRKAYLFIGYDNQAAILDSCTIRQGKFELKGILPYDEVSAEVIIEQIPASSGSIIVNQNETVQLVFRPLGKYWRPEAYGAKSHEELYLVINSPEAQNRIRLMTELRSLSETDPQYQSVRDSLNYYNTEDENRYRELLYRTKSGFNAIYASKVLNSSMSESERQEVRQYLVATFPDNVNISMITGTTPAGDPVPDGTTESKKAFNFYARVIGEVLPYPEVETGAKEEVVKDSDVSTAPVESGKEGFIMISKPPVKHNVEGSAQAADEPESDKIVIMKNPAASGNNSGKYRQNDLVADFSLPSLEDAVPLKLSDLKTDYVLIDFWASWCAPCLAEIPYLKKAQDEFGNKLTILSISIDSNLNHWKNAVEKNEMQGFVHAILRKDHPQFEVLRQRFDLQTIPTNFLLNRERRIIGVNLRGRDLQKILRQILSTE